MPTKRIIGDSGTIIFDGYISESDYNSDFRGERRIDNVDKMRMEDSSTQIALKVIKLPILSTRWYIEPASEDKKDVEVADFFEQMLFEDMTVTWSETLRQMLYYLDYGYYVFEQIFTDKEWNGQRYWALKKLAPRLPGTIQKWQTEDKKEGVTQFTITKGTVSIPIEKLLILTNEKDGDNWEGQSVLRSAWKHFYYKRAYYKIDAVASERQGVGIPKATKVDHKGGAKISDEKRLELINIMKNMRANHQQWLIEPEGWEISWMDMGANSIKDVKPMVEHHDMKIVQSVLAQFVLSGQNSVGSYGKSKAEMDFFALALNASATYIRDTFQKYVIDRLTDYNFVVDKAPQLKFVEIGDIDMNELSVSIQRLMQVKALTPTMNTEKHLRAAMKLPDLTEEEEAEIEEMKIEDREFKKTLNESKLMPNSDEKPEEDEDGKKDKKKKKKDKEKPKDDKKATNFLEEVRDRVYATIESISSSKAD